MSVYAISDLHLSFDDNKPMDVFGSNWEKHYEKIKEFWINNITETDIVLLPGDFSWAMYLEDTYKDFEYLNNLPGKKILLKGNHDYWWSTLTKMRKYLEKNNFKNIDFLQNNSYEYEDKIIVGTRGWGENNTSEDKKIINRELIRLEMSIKDGLKKYGEEKEIIACMHFPPFIDNRFINIMNKYKIKKCIYGHLHGISGNDAKTGKINITEYYFVSCDCINFKLKLID